MEPADANPPSHFVIVPQKGFEGKSPSFTSVLRDGCERGVESDFYTLYGCWWGVNPDYESSQAALYGLYERFLR